MGRTYNPKAWPIRYAPPWVQYSAGGAAAAVIAAAALLLAHTLARAMLQSTIPPLPIMQYLIVFCTCLGGIALLVSILSIAMAIFLYWITPQSAKIAYMVRRGLFSQPYGNPLKLQEGERLPKVKCIPIGGGAYYHLIVTPRSTTVEAVCDAASAISTLIEKKYKQYAITSIEPDSACNYVQFTIEDVTIDHSLSFNRVEDMHQDTPTRLIVQDGTYIDLTTSGSMLVAGKTRSGKTTGVIALLLQVLLAGRDAYGSECIVIDPKQAELSRLPHVVTLDEDGEAHNILDALKRFADSIKQRQKILNDISEQRGDAVKWWDAGMHPSFLFLDEYVACRSIFPKKAVKDSDYCLDTFDNLIKRIVTMGASAGCYVIISIAEASVQEGGLPAMLRSAMSTRILFRPTRAEGLLIWDKTKLDTMPDRVYGPGDAWFSSTDGEHDAVSCVHFPVMRFEVYRELGRLLAQYYGD